MAVSPRLDYRTCKLCERHADDCGPLSHQRLCERCATGIVAANLTGLRTKEGPAFGHWLRRSYMAVQRRLVALERGEA